MRHPSLYPRLIWYSLYSPGWRAIQRLDLASGLGCFLSTGFHQDEVMRTSPFGWLILWPDRGPFSFSKGCSGSSIKDVQESRTTSKAQHRIWCQKGSGVDGWWRLAMHIVSWLLAPAKSDLPCCCTCLWLSAHFSPPHPSSRIAASIHWAFILSDSAPGALLVLFPWILTPLGNGGHYYLIDWLIDQSGFFETSVFTL